jgi:hypothetical protein
MPTYTPLTQNPSYRRGARPLILVNVNDFRKLSRLATTASWLDEFLGLLNNGVELDLFKSMCRLGITTSDLAPGDVTKTGLAHGVLAGGKVESLRQAHCLAFSSADHVNCQRASRDKGQCSLHLTTVSKMILGR